MIEIDYQKMVVTYVNALGGFSTKLSHRFLVGVPDLFVKMPDDCPAAFLEVKLDDLPVKLLHVTITVTVSQWRFLRDSAAAGMTDNGVLSFIQSKDRSQLGALVVPVRDFGQSAIARPVLDYHTGTIKRNTANADRVTVIDAAMQAWRGSRG